MRTQSAVSMRIRTTIFASAMLPVATVALAGEVTTKFAAPTRNGTVSIFFTDLSGTTLSATANVNAGMNAAQKRQAIQNAIVGAGLPAGWMVAGNNDSLTVTNNNNLSMVANFNPRRTGELRDSLVVPGSRPTTFPGGHGNMDPHAPRGMSLSNGVGPAMFNAGVIVGGVEYLYSLSGDDPRFGGASTIDEISLVNYLYDGLSSLSLPGGVTLTNRGSAGIDVDFAPSVWSLGDYGIVWGTDSLIDDFDDDSGFRGSLENVPSPGAGALGMAAMVLTLQRRRRISNA
jgi:hypothetical protein